MSVFNIMGLLKEGEQVADRREVERRLYDMLHADVASGKVRMLDIDDPMFAEYLDGGWDATMCFYDYVQARRQKEAAIREQQAINCG